MQHLTTRLKKAIVVGALCLTCLGVLTSFQVAQAHPDVPAGCTRTALIDQCKTWRCFPRMWLGRSYYKIAWRCPDGSRAKYVYRGPCGDCDP